jgi:TIR domain
MPPSEQPRVFISCARKDGVALVQRLQKDLKQKGFDAWLDTQRIAGGAAWTTDIEHVLDEAEFVLALMASLAWADARYRGNHYYRRENHQYDDNVYNVLF